MFNNIYQVFKSFGENRQDLSEFSLQKVTDVYSDIQEGKEVYFLDAENKPVKVKSITKKNYQGKIYILNNIILVRMDSDGSVFWGIKRTAS